MRALVWLRTDLRISDNRALHRACAEADSGVIALFVASPWQWRTHDWSPRKVGFLRRNLEALSASLRRLNIPLLIRAAPTFAGLPRVLSAVARATRSDSLFFSREYEVNEIERDRAVSRAITRAGLSVRASDDQTILPPGSVSTAAGRQHKVFTPFRRAWLNTLADEGGPKVLGSPRKQAELAVEPDDVPRAFRGFNPEADLPDIWPAGEREARRRLNTFLRERIGRYARDRDSPDGNTTSTLSPYLALGVVSARECYRAALAALADDARLRSGVESWTGELIWREFYKHLLAAFPRLSMNQPFKPETRSIRWRENERDLAAWEAGKTGYPIVDAGMRQLRSIGWMHNRARMITAMFLSKHLLLDWRLGERHFMRNLVDGDLAANNGGWQWCASTGADAAPYFRIFNPLSQSRRFDPQGRYIRRWVPELGSLPAAALHDADILARHLNGEARYPKPICEHASARRRAISRFAEARTV